MSTPPTNSTHQLGSATDDPLTDITVSSDGEELSDRDSSSDEDVSPRSTQVSTELNESSALTKSKKTFTQRIGISKLGPALWILALLIPNLFTVLVLGVIPLGDPHEDFFTQGGMWPFAFFITPGVMTVVGYLNISAFYGCASIERPFRSYAPIMGVTYVAELLLIPILATVGVFEFLGVVAIFICYVVTFTGVFINEWLRKNRGPKFLVKFRQYLIVTGFIFLHICFLVLYIIAYREAPSEIQPIFTFASTIVSFILKKTLLALCDMFPIEMAMLISGLWVENMEDMFQTLAYPSVKDPINYVYIFFVNFFSNVANLLFLTPQWFKFRVWIKGVLGCKCKNMPLPDYEELEDDRGHGPNRPGYLRRQVRFYIWKILSQFVSAIFYLMLSAVLRYGLNHAYYPFSDDPITHNYKDESSSVITFSSSCDGSEEDDCDDDTDFNLNIADYRNSMIYAGANLPVIVLSGLACFLIMRFCMTKTYRALLTVHAQVFLKNYYFMGFVMAILTHNALIGIFMVQYHARIWWAFSD